METDLMEKFKASEEVILSGDCGIDSPGFSAVIGTYSFMDHTTGIILSMEHGHKWQIS